MTQTAINAENGRVVIRHSTVVGTQWLTPEQARELGHVLVALATVAEQQKQAMTS